MSPHFNAHKTLHCTLAREYAKYPFFFHEILIVYGLIEIKYSIHYHNVLKMLNSSPPFNLYQIILENLLQLLDIHIMIG